MAWCKDSIESSSFKAISVLALTFKDMFISLRTFYKERPCNLVTITFPSHYLHLNFSCGSPSVSPMACKGFAKAARALQMFSVFFLEDVGIYLTKTNLPSLASRAVATQAFYAEAVEFKVS